MLLQNANISLFYPRGKISFKIKPLLEGKKRKIFTNTFTYKIAA